MTNAELEQLAQEIEAMKHDVLTLVIPEQKCKAWAVASFEDAAARIRSKKKPVRHKRTVWINVYNHYAVCCSSRKNADEDTTHGRRIACIKVDLDFEEGEGITHGTYSVSSGGSPPFDNGGGFTPTTWIKVTKEGL
jgi:hypothetical protein